MAGLDSWTQIPSSVLDLADKAQQAETWAAGQRAQLAETWANAQRQALGAMATTWQNGMSALDNFRQGYQGPSGYNDMAGASSSYGDTNPAQSLTALDQATSPQGPQQSDTSATPLLPGNQPLTDLGNAAANAVIGRINETEGNLEQAYTPTSNQPAPGLVQRLGGYFTPEQIAQQDALGTNAVLGVTGGEDVPLVPEARAALGQLGRGAVSELGNVAQGILGQDTTRMYHGTPTPFDVPNPSEHSDTNFWPPALFMSPDPEKAGKFLETRGRVQSGANMRAIDVPANVRLFDTDSTIPKETVDRIHDLLTPAGPDVVKTFDQMMTNYFRGNTQGQNVYFSLLQALQGKATAPGSDTKLIGRILHAVGYDGIHDPSGWPGPSTDAGQVMIFPEALGKIRNALSGTYGGLLDEAQAAKRTVQATEVAGPGAIGTEGIAPPPPEPPAAPPTLAGKLARGALIGGGKQAIGAAIAESQQPNATPGSIALAGLEGLPIGAAKGALGVGLREGLPANISGQVNTALSRIANAAPTSEEGFAGNIRLEKLPEGVRDIVTEAYNQAPATFEAARRGVIPDAQVQQLADAVGQNVNKIVDRWKPGQAQNAETLYALRNALAAKAQDVATLKDAAAQPNATPLDLLKFQAALRDQVALQQTVAGTTAEAGRALRQFRQTVSGAIASGDTQKITDTLNRLGGVEWTQELAQKLSQLDTTDPVASYQFMRDALNPKLKNDLFGVWYNAMLSNPHTLAVKTMSELTSLALSPIERGFAAAAELPLAALQGRPRERFFGEIKPDIVGMANGVPEGVTKALFLMQHGFSMSDALAGGDFIRTEAFQRLPAVSSVVNAPSRLLQAGVELFGSIAQAGALNAGAYRLARLEGKTGDAIAQRMAELRANPTPALLKYAQDQGAYRVYQQKPGQMMQQFLRLRNTDFHGVPVLRIIVPFAQTPANLLKFGLERSPLALFNVDAWKNLASKNPNAADNIGRWVMGSSIGAALTLYAGAGNITGLAPTNPTEKLAWEREGKQPNSIKIGNTWINVSKVPVLADTLLQVATIADGIRQGQDVTGIAGRLAATIGTNVSNQPYLTGVSTLMQALHDPTAYGQQFVNTLAASAVPALSRAVAQTIDPTQRQTTNIPEALQAEIPGLSQQLPAKIGAFGEERQREASVFSPLPTTQSHVSPVDAELTKYGVEPGVSGKTLRGLDLTRQEQADYQRLSGQSVKQLLDSVIRDPRYQQADDPTKARILQRAITLAKDQAAQTYIRQLAQQQGQNAILQRIQQKKLQRLPAA